MGGFIVLFIHFVIGHGSTVGFVFLLAVVVVVVVVAVAAAAAAVVVLAFIVNGRRVTR